MPQRSDSTLGRVQRKILGPVPTSRESYDPAHILQFAPDGDKIMCLDSKDLREDWNDVDLSVMINSLRKHRNEGTQSEGSLSDNGSQVLIIFIYILIMCL